MNARGVRTPTARISSLETCLDRIGNQIVLFTARSGTEFACCRVVQFSCGAVGFMDDMAQITFTSVSLSLFLSQSLCQSLCVVLDTFFYILRALGIFSGRGHLWSKERDTSGPHVRVIAASDDRTGASLEGKSISMREVGGCGQSHCGKCLECRWKPDAATLPIVVRVERLPVVLFGWSLTSMVLWLNMQLSMPKHTSPEAAQEVAVSGAMRFQEGRRKAPTVRTKSRRNDP